MNVITEIKPSGKPGCHQEGRAFWPLFGREVCVAIGGEGEISPDYARRCVAQLLTPAPDTERRLLEASVRCFRDAECCHGEPIEFLFEFEGMPRPRNLEIPENLLPYLRPVEIRVEQEIPKLFSAAAFLECAWEPEHGISWVVRDGKPLFVGADSGLGSHCAEEVYFSVWKESNYLLWESGQGRG